MKGVNSFRFWFVEIGSSKSGLPQICYLAEDDFALPIILSTLPKCWAHRWIPPYEVQ